MLVVLDTNHLREYLIGSQSGHRLVTHLANPCVDIFTSIVSVEESVQGWLALLRRQTPGTDQINTYARFQSDVEAISGLAILPFDEEAAALFAELRKTHRRIGTMDLKIAAICLACDATLLTRNLADFEGIAGLRVENWLD